MLRPFAVVAPTVLLFGLGLATQPALADVGPPDRSCTVEKRCADKGVECRYLNSQPDAGDLQCVADAERRGMERVCSRGGGTSGVDVFCPKGTGTKASGCAVGVARSSTGGGGALLALVATVAVASVRRRRARR